MAACACAVLLLLQVMMKLGSHVDADGRARACGLCHALVLLSQGVPFIHAGDDLLRSKSLDRDSYNSGGAHSTLGGWVGLWMGSSCIANAA